MRIASITGKLGAAATLFLVFVAQPVLWLGCASYPPEMRWRLFGKEQAPLHVVSSGQQLRSAEKWAARSSRAFVLIGSGASMEPAYPAGTALVVEERGYRELRAGMCAVYRNAQGFYVAHVVVERLPKGWVAIGLNNAREDEDYITPRNFVGVITAAFVPHG